ncbi:MAG: hypothetical protein CL792_01695 [Chloroflexi bacterium]|nr:hypothetical protein [Chloroflexota bacterium]|tara:strand:+ start:496 stop:774 length:279 start_codon:yes stop_codon:yes gene_type:complete
MLKRIFFLNRMKIHHLFVLVGTFAGLLSSIFFFTINPPVLGWLFGTGIGLSGSAFFVAIFSGEPLAGSTGSTKSNWHLEDLYHTDNNENSNS